MLGSVITKGAHLGIEKYVNSGKMAGVGEKMAVNFFTEEKNKSRRSRNIDSCSRTMTSRSSSTSTSSSEVEYTS